MADPSTFQHSRIEPARGEIRLVKVLAPTQDDDRIHCTIKHDFLRSGLHYQAISYRWGDFDPQSDGVIFIDGRSHTIRSNLFDFMERAQSKFANEWLWIDQICIHQSSSSEKEETIPMMGSIFQNAKRTIAWLGAWPGDPYIPGIENVEDDDSEHFFNRIVYSSYWERLWIIQEIVLSRNILLLDDWSSSSYEAFATWLDDRVSGLHEAAFDGFHETRIQHLSYRRRGYLAGNYRTRWRDVVLLIEGAVCANVHDRIYGIMGLIGPSHRVEADESKDLATLYVNVLAVDVDPEPEHVFADNQVQSLDFSVCELAEVLVSELMSIPHPLKLLLPLLEAFCMAPLALGSCISRVEFWDHAVHSIYQDLAHGYSKWIGDIRGWRFTSPSCKPRTQTELLTMNAEPKIVVLEDPPLLPFINQVEAFEFIRNYRQWLGVPREWDLACTDPSAIGTKTSSDILEELAAYGDRMKAYHPERYPDDTPFVIPWSIDEEGEALDLSEQDKADPETIHLRDVWAATRDFDRVEFQEIWSATRPHLMKAMKACGLNDLT